jgi:hypothetical protein
MTENAKNTKNMLRLSKPNIGYVTVTVAGLDIHGVSYINPWLIEDLTDWLQAVIDERDCVIRLDREGLGMAYIACSETQDVIVACDSGASATEIFCDDEEIVDCAKTLADDIEANFDEWVDWQCPEDTVEDVQKATASVRNTIKRLRSLKRTARQDG